MVRLCTTTLLVMGLLHTFGCGQNSGFESVSGTINFKGKPLDYGAIIFVPEAMDAGLVGRTAIITNGQYSLPAAEGLKPGKYIVKITSGEAAKKVKEDELPGEPVPTKERIPAKYNEFSNMTFDVQAGQPNVFSKDIP
jgi:hypothetical protein